MRDDITEITVEVETASEAARIKKLLPYDTTVIETKPSKITKSGKTWFHVITELHSPLDDAISEIRAILEDNGYEDPDNVYGRKI